MAHSGFPLFGLRIASLSRFSSLLFRYDLAGLAARATAALSAGPEWLLPNCDVAKPPLGLRMHCRQPAARAPGIGGGKKVGGAEAISPALADLTGQISGGVSRQSDSGQLEDTEAWPRATFRDHPARAARRKLRIGTCARRQNDARLRPEMACGGQADT